MITVAGIALIALAAAIDLRSRRIPNVLVIAAFLLVLAGSPDRADALAGAALAAGPLFALAAFRPGAMGMGDAKLAAAAGAVVGLSGVSMLLLATALLGGALAVFVTMRRGSGATFAYGPAIAGALLIALI